MSNTITPFKAKVSGLAISVPDDAKDFHFGKLLGMNSLVYKKSHYKKGILLPTGSWRILGIADELTEEQWMEVVWEQWIFGNAHKSYQNYSPLSKSHKGLSTATESGKSLMASLKVEGRNVIIIEK